MGMGKTIENRGHITGFKEEIQSATQLSKDAFFTWFSDSKDTDSAFIRGAWDFMLHIAVPLSKYISVPEEKIALEIGYGGGRILAAACNGFKQAIGIDIHDNNAFVEKELKCRGILNYKLWQSDGYAIPVPENSVDVVYSFIVLQHVEKIEIFKQYALEAYRILKPDGVAILYFGRKCFFSANKASKVLYLLDCILEKIVLRKGFKEIAANVNCTNLVLSAGYAKKIFQKTGFKVLEQIVSHKKVPDGIALFGGQHGFILRKKT